MRSPDARRVLVTGGAGFLGSHLCERLVGDGHEVICVDNLSTGTRDNLRHLALEFHEHDISEALPTLPPVSYIYNLACPASPPQYQRDPLATLRANTHGLWRLLDFARECGAAVLQASTSEVYGQPALHPQPESYWGHVNPVGPRSCYDEGKRCAETLCRDYARTHGVRVQVVRIFNTYGPRMAHDDGRVVSNFIAAAVRNEALTIYGTGLQTRCFCYVDDLVDGLVRIMASTAHGPVNLGSDTEVTIAALADRVRGLAGITAPVIAQPLPVDDPSRRRPDLTLARQLIGWNPPTTLDTGLTRMLAWAREEWAE